MTVLMAYSARSSPSGHLLGSTPGVTRTSSLYAPIMRLEGHAGAVFALDFSAGGEYVASSSFDKQICKCHAAALALAHTCAPEAAGCAS